MKMIEDDDNKNEKDASLDDVVASAGGMEVSLDESYTVEDKSPYFDNGRWWLPVRFGVAACGVVQQAPKKSNRIVLDFTLPDGKRKKYYRCEFCTHKTVSWQDKFFNKGSVSEWIFHKNYVHQHIPRRHPEECAYCEYCCQLIFREVFAVHQRTCQKRIRTHRSRRSVRSSFALQMAQNRSSSSRHSDSSVSSYWQKIAHNQATEKLEHQRARSSVELVVRQTGMEMASPSGLPQHPLDLSSHITTTCSSTQEQSFQSDFEDEPTSLHTNLPGCTVMTIDSFLADKEEMYNPKSLVCFSHQGSREVDFSDFIDTTALMIERMYKLANTIQNNVIKNTDVNQSPSRNNPKIESFEDCISVNQR